MQYDQFLAEWMGRQVTAYGGECVALVAQYCAENNMPIAWANAKDWWQNPALAGAFDFIANDPSNYNQLPARGNIIVWNGDLPGSGGYGHIAIWDMVVRPGLFNSFDQNWGGAQAHFQQHTWDYIIGWLSPKAAPAAPAPHPDPSPPPVDTTPPPVPPAPVEPPKVPVDPPVTPPVVPPTDPIPGPEPPVEPAVPVTPKDNWLVAFIKKIINALFKKKS